MSNVCGYTAGLRLFRALETPALGVIRKLLGRMQDKAGPHLEGTNGREETKGELCYRRPWAGSSGEYRLSLGHFKTL